MKPTGALGKFTNTYRKANPPSLVSVSLKIRFGIHTNMIFRHFRKVVVHTFVKTGSAR